MTSTLISLAIGCLFLAGSVFAETPSNLSNDKLHDILPVVNQKVTYTDVVDCGSVMQTDVFRRARLWIGQFNLSAPAMFPIMDKETGDLAGRLTQVVRLPRTDTSPGGVYTFHYNLSIECANRKYRATITRIDLEENGTDKRIPIELYSQKNEKDLQAIYIELNKQLTGVLASLQESVKNYKPF